MFTPKAFYRFTRWTLYGIIGLFFLGGLVRTTGSGMGCPDWPKCFGSWVPPTEASELPENYKDVYTAKREHKLERLIKILNNIGMQESAAQLAQVQLVEGNFNVRKTYTEYVNRLWGALTGIWSFLALIASVQFWKSNKLVPIMTFVGLFFVGFNGWLGSVVVDSQLLGGVVTLHFVLAFFAIAAYMIAYYATKDRHEHSTKAIRALIVIGTLLAFVQLLTGTAVREQVDVLAAEGTRMSIDNYNLLGTTFNIHRIASVISGILLLVLWQLNRKHTARPKMSMVMIAAIVMLGLQALTGIVNIRLTFPDVAQVLHVTLGSLTVVAFIYLAIHEFKTKHVN